MKKTILLLIISVLFANCSTNNESSDNSSNGSSNGSSVSPKSEWVLLNNITGKFISPVGNDGLFIGGGGNYPNPKIYYSKDNGISWTNNVNFPVNYNINDIIDTGDGLLAGTNNGTFYSNDNFLTLKKQSDIYNMKFYKIKNYILSTYGTSAVYKSTDNGKTWAFSGTGIYNTMSGDPEIKFINLVGNTIFAGSINGRMYKSIDDGKTWAFSDNGLPYPLNPGSMTAISNVIYTTCGKLDGKSPTSIYKSTDNGVSWQSVDSILLSNRILSSGCLASYNNKLYICTTSDIVNTSYKIISSSDGGVNWDDLKYNGSQYLDALKVINGNLFAIGNEGGIYYLKL